MKELLKKILMLVKKGALAKDGTITMKKGQYMIRTEEAVLGHLRPILQELGLIIVMDNIESVFASSTTIKIIVHLKIYDVDSGLFIPFAGIGSGIDPADKDSGKALTYAYRNAIQKLVMMVSGEDSDQKSSEDVLNDLKVEAVMLCEKLWKLKAFHSPLKDGSECDAETASARYSKRITLVENMRNAAELNETIHSMRDKQQELIQK